MAIFGRVDLSEPAGAPILERLRGIPSTLRFILDHPLEHIKAMGFTSASYCGVRSALPFAHARPSVASFVRVCAVYVGFMMGGFTYICCVMVPLQTFSALAFGKDEDGGYEFTQDIVQDIVKALLTRMSMAVTIDPAFIRPVLCLCISGPYASEAVYLSARY